MLTKNEFLVANELNKNHAITSQLQLAKLIGLSVGTVNSTIRGLREKRWVEDDRFELSYVGEAMLEPYRVDNAIILAAGLSSRFAPVSYERPKGLLRVRGEVLIERQIRQLQEAGITNITVVVGYMKELFFYLGDKYGVDIVVNESYAERNSHSSLYLVRDRLERSFICSSDNYFTQNVFEPYVYEAYYAAVHAEGVTEEWCLEVGSYDVIEEVSYGGEDAWYMLGHVFFDEAFSQGMRDILEAEYELPVTKDKLWEHLYVDHIVDLRMVMRRYPDGVIYEFDSLEDMNRFDPSFIDNVDSEILANIAEVLKCERTDIVEITPIKLGATNLSCRFRVGDDWYVYRHPGTNAKRFINRASEAFSEGVAKELGLDETFIYEDPKRGWKIAHYLDNCWPLDYQSPLDVAEAMRLARTLHESGVTSPWETRFLLDADVAIEALEQSGRTAFPEFAELKACFEQLSDLVQRDGVEPCLCHNNFLASNYLVTPDRVDLIDWEYSGMGDYAADLGTFICGCADFDYDDVLDILKVYFEREPTAQELRHCVSYVSIMGFLWYVWALYEDMNGVHVGELLYAWYRYARDYGRRALELYGTNLLPSSEDSDDIQFSQ